MTPLTIESRRILVVLPHLKIGGAQRQALLLTKELIAKGINVRVALVGLEGDRRKRDYDTLEREFGLDEDVVINAGYAPIVRIFLGIARFVKLRISIFRRRGLTHQPRFSFARFLVRFLRRIGSRWPQIVPKGPIFIRALRLWRIFKIRGTSLLLAPELRKAIFAILAEHPHLLGHLERQPSLLLRAHYIQTIMRSEAPDMVIGFLTQTNLACLIAGYRSHVPILISERNDVLLQPVSPHVSALRNELYKRAEIITANSPSGKEGLTQLFPGQEIRLMANDFPRTIARRPLTTRRVGVVCRLEKQKNVDLIIRGFVQSELAENGWRLEIWGEGPESEYLAKTIHKMHADQTVQLMGVTKNPLDAMRKIDFLVAASSYEGSSNSIHEAVSAGAVPLYSNSIAEMTYILPPALREIFGFQPDPDAISETLRQVTIEDFRDSDAVEVLRNNFERFWEASRTSRAEMLEEIEGILGFRTPDNGNLMGDSVTKSGAPEHVRGRNKKLMKVRSW